MFRRTAALLTLGIALVFLAGCHHSKVTNPIANLDSKQPDKTLFDRAMDAMKHGKYDTARLLLQTMINSYPDSEYVARAKLAVGDSWFAEGNKASLAQAEAEYKDFQTFFPNMPEAAEAQLKVARIHFKQMEKMDRDPTEAYRAEDEYRQLILQYPDNPLVKTAKEELRMVQEVLAQREFAVGRFYYMRQSYVAAAARLESLSQTYPLFSNADEALYMLGQSYEKWAGQLELNAKNPKMPGSEGQKIAVVKEKQEQAAQAYSKILTRYPVMERAGDAKGRLEAMHRPVPTATPEMIAQNKAEEESRSSSGFMGRVMNTFHHGPDMASAARVGDPQMQAPKPVSAVDLVAATSTTFNKAGEAEIKNGGGTVGVERVNPNGSANGNGAGDASNPKQPAVTGQPDNSSQLPAAQQQPGAGIEELKPAPAAGTNPPPAQPSAQPDNQPEQPATTQPNNQPTAPAPAATQPETPAAGNSLGQTGNQNNEPPAQIQTGVSASEAAAKSDNKNDPNTSSSSRSKKKKKKVQDNPQQNH